MLDLKLNAWTKLPLRLCGLAVPLSDADRIAQVARDCLQQYASSPDAGAHHRVSNLFCSPKGPLHASMVSVANGEPLQNHLQLHRAVQILKMIPVAEHVIEGPHASTQREILKAPRCGPSAVSMALRGPEIERFVDEGPAWASLVLAENLDLVPNLDKAVRVLGLDSHPLVVNCQGPVTHGVACSIIYRCDAESNFQDLREVQKTVLSAKDKDNKQREKQEARRGKKMVASTVQGDARPDWFFQSLLFDFLRSDDNHDAHVFSLPAAVSATSGGLPQHPGGPDKHVEQLALIGDHAAQPPGQLFRSMRSVIACAATTAEAKHGDGTDGTLLCLESDVGLSSNLVSAPFPQHTFPESADFPASFRVVHKRPSRQKVQHVKPGVGQKLKDTDIAITKHQCLESSETSAKIRATPLTWEPDQSGSATMLLDTAVPLGSRHVLVKQLLKWEFAATCEHQVPGFPQELLEAMLQHGAFEDRQAYFVPTPESDAHAELRKLQTRIPDAVLSHDIQNVVGYQLTHSTMRKLQLTFHLHRPTPVGVLPDPVEKSQAAIEALHPCQLWMLMERQGWQPDVCKKKDLIQKLPYRPGVEKVFFVSSAGAAPPSRWYLLALCLTESVWSQRTEEELLPVMHSWQINQYRGFVESEGTRIPAAASKMPRLALQDDDGAAALPAPPGPQKRVAGKAKAKRPAKSRRIQPRPLADLPDGDRECLADAQPVQPDERSGDGVADAEPMLDIEEGPATEASPSHADGSLPESACHDSSAGITGTSSSSNSSSSSSSGSSSSPWSPPGPAEEHESPGGPAAAVRVRAHRNPPQVSEDSHDWGVFHINWRRPNDIVKFGGWSATCRFHAVPGRKACTRSMSVQSADDKDAALRFVRHWCNCATAVETREEHMAMARRPAEALEEDLLEGMLEQEDLDAFLEGD